MLLMMGTDQAIDNLAQGDDFMFFDRARVPAKPQTAKVALVVGVADVGFSGVQADHLMAEEQRRQETSQQQWQAGG